MISNLIYKVDIWLPRSEEPRTLYLGNVPKLDRVISAIDAEIRSLEEVAANGVHSEQSKARSIQELLGYCRDLVQLAKPDFQDEVIVAGTVIGRIKWTAVRLYGGF